MLYFNNWNSPSSGAWISVSGSDDSVPGSSDLLQAQNNEDMMTNDDASFFIPAGYSM